MSSANLVALDTGAIVNEDRAVSPTLSQAVGDRIRQIREAEGITGDSLAGSARFLGLRWSRQTLTALESGQRELQAEELFILPIAFHYLGVETSVVDLVGDGCDLTSKIRATPDSLGILFGGSIGMFGLFDVALPTDNAMNATGEYLAGFQDELVEIAATYPDIDEFPDRWVTRMYGAEREEAIQKASRRLGVSPVVVVAASFTLWGRSLTTERERRLGDDPDASPARLRALRGRITRTLLDELQAVLETG